MKRVSSGSVVCCPKCGAPATVSEIGMDRLKCRKCNLDFCSWVIGGFVTTFEANDADTMDSKRKIEDYWVMLQKLSNLNNIMGR